MPIVKDRNNIIIGISASSSPLLQKKVYDGKNYVEIGSLRPSQYWKWVTKLTENIKPFSVFDNTLKKIYGKEFFDDKPAGDFDGDMDSLMLKDVVILKDIEHPIRYLLTMQDPISVAKKWMESSPVGMVACKISACKNLDKDWEPDDNNKFFVNEEKWR